MIRINLLGGGGTSVGAAESAKSAISNLGTTLISPTDTEGGMGDVLLKFMFLFLPVMFLYGYQETEVGKKQNQVEDVRRNLERVSAELKSKKVEVDKVERFKADKTQLEQRVSTIKELSKARLRNVKALDAIQNIMPTKAWLTRLVLNDKKIDLQGKAIEDTDISALMQGLEENIYFMQVVLISSEQSRSADGVVKSFNVSASMENL
ncbi:MAG: PilN domain-containing protein [Bdellovibrionales bacterium]